MKKALLLFLVIILAMSVFAKSASSEKEIQEIVRKTVDMFSDGDFAKAMEFLKPYCVVNATSLDDLAVKTKQQWSFVVGNYGKKIGIEFIDKQKAGNSFLKYIIAVKYEWYALKFQVVCYFNNSEWKVTSFVWDDTISDLPFVSVK